MEQVRLNTPSFHTAHRLEHFANAAPSQNPQSNSTIQPMVSDNWFIHAGNTVVNTVIWIGNMILNFFARLFCMNNNLRCFENFARMKPEEAQKAFEKDPVGYLKMFINAFKQDGGKFIKIFVANKENIVTFLAMHDKALGAQLDTLSDAYKAKGANYSMEEKLKDLIKVYIGNHHYAIDVVVDELYALITSPAVFSQYIKAISDAGISLADNTSFMTFVVGILQTYREEGAKGVFSALAELNEVRQPQNPEPVQRPRANAPAPRTNVPPPNEDALHQDVEYAGLERAAERRRSSSQSGNTQSL